MSVYQLKTQFQSQLRPVSNKLVSLGISANQVTFSAIVLSAGTAYVIAKIPQSNIETAYSKAIDAHILKPVKQAHLTQAQQAWWLLPLSLFIRMALNAIDGMMAREHDQASTFGAVLNEVGDIVSDTLLIGSLLPHIAVFDKPTYSFTNIKTPKKNGAYSNSLKKATHLKLIIGLSTLTELIAIIATLSTQQRANHGPLGKSDRALQLGAIGTFLAVGASRIFINKHRYPTATYIRPLLWLNELLLIKTSGNRLNYLIHYHCQHLFEKWHPAPAISVLNTDNSPFLLITNNALPSLNLANTTTDSHHNHANFLSLQGCNPMPAKTTAELDNQPLQNPSEANKAKRAHVKQAMDALIDNTDNESFDKTDLTQATSSTIKDEEGSSIIAAQSCFNAYDGTALYYRYWLTIPLADIHSRSDKSANQQVILLHRGHEHSGRLEELGERFAQAGYQVFAWDARGNGRSGGIKDHADSVTELERDLNDFVNLVIEQTGIALENTVIVASSIGAVLAAAWVHDYAPTIRGMILGTPALSIRLYIPFAIPALKIARKFGLMPRVSSYVKAQVLTHDKDAQAAYNADPLISGSISSDLLIDTHATGQRLLEDAGAITAPTFILCAGKDYVVDKQAERQFYEGLSSATKRWQLYPDSFHAIFHETNKADIFSDCIDFANSLFKDKEKSADLSNAHQDSASKDKVDRLAIKPFNLSFAITRLAMQKFGHASDAIATGLEHGFDSGSSLDKVYENNPQGANAFGKAVDKFYLSNIGWQGIRIRRQHLLELGRLAIDARLQANNQTDKALRVLDIASGNGYYVFDLLAEYDNLQAEMRDYDAHNIKVIADKAQQLSFANRVNAVQKDAFDADSYKASGLDNLSKNSFDIAISSGVFELFSDNTLVSTALRGLHTSLASDGYLLYTNQPWHPEQEFISKTLNNHRGTDWVMRCRSQAEMDQLVTNAGFKKLAMRIDRFGIFTVSLAIKID